MNIQLILVDECASCKQTETLWTQLCEDFGFALEVLKLDERDGEGLAATLGLSTFPALVVDGRVKSVGAPDRDAAELVLQQLPNTHSTLF